MSYIKYPFKVKPLPYKYNALEPIISAKTLFYHHDKHYQTYVDNLNKYLENIKYIQDMTLEEIIIYTANKKEFKNIFNNAGGVYNHMKYFDSLRPIESSNTIDSELLYKDIRENIDDNLEKQINMSFGTIENMIKIMVEMSNSLFGSGYVWLSLDIKGIMYIRQYKNQDTPLTEGNIPLLPIDVWEHAYYIDYRNRRTEYVKNIMKIINWKII